MTPHWEGMRILLVFSLKNPMICWSTRHEQETQHGQGARHGGARNRRGSHPAKATSPTLTLSLSTSPTAHRVQGSCEAEDA